MWTVTEKFNHGIDRINILKEPTIYIGNYFDNHPTICKVSLIINHLFRVGMMVGIMFIPGIPPVVSMTLCFAGSLFYRLTVEKNCAYKFALPSFAGAAAFMLAIPSLINMAHGMAFVSPVSGVISCISLVPLPFYAGYVLLTVNYDVNKAHQRFLDEREREPEKEEKQQPAIEEKCCCK